MPFGHYCFNKLPFGKSYAPELFWQRMSTILLDLSGTISQMDDVLVFGKTQQEHDDRLTAVLLERIRDAEVTIKPDKFVSSKWQVNIILQHCKSRCEIHDA